MGVNLRPAFLLAKRLAPGMRERGWGRVVLASSVAAFTGELVGPHYTTLKAALIGLARALAGPLAPHGVTVNAIGPTYIETALSAPELARPGIRDGIVSRIPMGRLGTPEDLVSAAVFLCSESARFVTGQTLYVDGGRTAD